MQSRQLWMVTFRGVSLALALSGIAFAQGGPIVLPEDHLKCYNVTADELGGPPVPPPVPATLFGHQFGKEECRVVQKAALFCAPNVKCVTDANGQQVCDAPPTGGQLQTDFLCYKLRGCKPLQERELTVVDQFKQRKIKIKPAQMLCTPARKVPPPPPFCGNSKAPLCGGECEKADEICRTDSTGQRCECQPATPPPCNLTQPPQCGGLCPPSTTGVLRECKPQSLTGGPCVCQPVEPCGRIPGTNQCGGDCPPGPVPLFCLPGSAAGDCVCRPG
jgi:hypothetical protein